ncbi:unnamed protein product, partial [Ectocarpus sp. 12 AP-2014]
PPIHLARDHIVVTHALLLATRLMNILLLLVVVPVVVVPTLLSREGDLGYCARQDGFRPVLVGVVELERLERGERFRRDVIDAHRKVGLVVASDRHTVKLGDCFVESLVVFSGQRLL